MSYPHTRRPVAVSIGVFASNEEGPLRAALEALFRQSVFERLGLHESSEVLVIAHGCRDGTAAIARDAIARMQREHAWATAIAAHTIEIDERSRNLAWNRFVHAFSAVEARYLVTLHADVLLHHRDAIAGLVAALAYDPRVRAAFGDRVADVLFKERRTFWERLAARATSTADDAEPRLNGEFCALRAATARKLSLPAELGAGADDFATAVLGSDFLRGGFDPSRLARPREAAHIWPAPTNPHDALNTRKRRMLGQAASSVLLDYLRGLPRRDRVELAATLQRHAAADPAWLATLIAKRVCGRAWSGRLIFDLLAACGRGVCPRMCRHLAWIPEIGVGLILDLIACLRVHRLLRTRAAEVLAQPSRAADVPASTR